MLNKITKKYHGIRTTNLAERYIRLPEWPPNSLVEFYPSEKYAGNKINYSRKRTTIVTDEHGFIGPTNIHRAPDMRIVFLGSSTTENRFMDQEKRFPYLVGRTLESNIKKRVNAYNAGFRGNNIVHCMNVFINKVLCINPDIVLIMNNVIDLNTLLLDQSYWYQYSSERKKKYNERSLLVDPTHKLSHRFVRFVKSIVRGREKRLSRGDNITLLGHDGYEKLFKSLVMTIFACNIRPIIMTEPGLLSEYNHDLTKYKIEKVDNARRKYGHDGYVDLFRKFNQIVRDISEELHVDLIDLDRELSGDGSNFIDLNHLSEKGNGLASAIIADYIASNGRVQGRLNVG